MTQQNQPIYTPDDRPHTYIRKIDEYWYAFEGDESGQQVYSIGSDSPDNGRYYANWTDSGIQYVAHRCPTRAAAYAKARRWGKYSGEA